MTTATEGCSEWAIGLAEKLLASDVPRRWTHVQGAVRRACSVSVLTEQDADLLVAAVALHDIGFSHRLGLEPSGFPLYDAVRYLESIGAPRRLIGLVANHANAHVEGDLRGLGEQIARYEDEKSLVRDALWYSCLTAGPDGQPMDFDARVEEWLDRYAADPVMGTFTEMSLPELRAAIDRVEEAKAAGVAGA
ncbi:MAG TPA: phosphohydrolase [Pseudonocardia sp.]|jgi:hypothetical protein|nr:phosphohydrolase [Pseudonocardia sp.]